MALQYGEPCLARVQGGWTGTITLSHPSLGYSTTTTPRARESVASLLLRACQDFTGTVGVLPYANVTVRCSAAGVVTIYDKDDPTSNFNMSFSGTCATRTGFTAGPYSGAASYTAAAGLATTERYPFPIQGGRIGNL